MHQIRLIQCGHRNKFAPPLTIATLRRPLAVIHPDHNVRVLLHFTATQKGTGQDCCPCVHVRVHVLGEVKVTDSFPLLLIS